MKDIKTLELELSKAKKIQQQKDWEKYLDQCESYLKGIVGKTFMKWYQNGCFIIFKVNGYEPKYYADRNGWNGNWHPSRWFELKSTQSINCRVKDSSGKYFRPEVKYSNFKFNVVTGKSKNQIETMRLDFVDYETEKYTYLPSEVREFGKLQYYKEIPDFIEELSNFKMFLREAPEGMFEEAKKIADENIMKTKQFWDKYENKIQNS